MHDTAAAPYRINALLAVIAIAIAAAMLAIVPLTLLPQSPALAAAAVAALALATPFHTAVLHEAIHRRLAADHHRNDRLGRALALCNGVAFDIVRFGHLSHHLFNRHALDRPDVIEPGQGRLDAGIRYFGHLMGGLYLSEIAATLAMLLPRALIERLLTRAMAKDEPALMAIRHAAGRTLERRIRRVRTDALLALAIYAAALHLYGEWWALLAMGMVLRGAIISLQDNLPHYGTPASIGAPAHNSRAPRWASLFMLHQNLHAVHHEQPDLSWNALPGAFARTGANYSAGYFSQLVRQFRGPWRPGPAT